jgi:hypothetical protein
MAELTIFTVALACFLGPLVFGLVSKPRHQVLDRVTKDLHS